MRKQVDKVNQVVSEPASEVFEAIHAIMHLYRSQQYRSLRGEANALTHMENKVLGFFARHPGATQSELVIHSGRDKAQLARLIRALKDQGLLEAHADAADRRSARLHITAAGRGVHESLHMHGARLSNAALAGLDEDERRVLASLLGRVQKNLEADVAQD